MELQDSLNQVLSSPTPEALWRFRENLTIAGYEDDSSIMRVVDRFYSFINELVARSTAREYSHFAAKLDMAAVAGVALENLIGEKDAKGFWSRAFLGAASETMMVLAARQYVKAWEEEMKASYHEAAWYLSQEFWKLSRKLQPEISDEVRIKLTSELTEPIQSSEVDGLIKAAIIVRLFQLLLLARLTMAIQK